MSTQNTHANMVHTGFRITEAMRDQLQAIADAERRSLSTIIAIACEQLIARHGRGEPLLAPPAPGKKGPARAA